MDKNQQIEDLSRHLAITFALAQKTRPVATWDGLTEDERRGWIRVAIIALQADKPQYRLEIVRSTPITVPHLRIKPPRGKEIILSGEQLVNMAGARRTAKHLAEAARRGFRIVEVVEGSKS